MVLTVLQDIVKLMFEMTNASECHRDAVFVCGGDRFVVFDRSAETGDWCQACDLRFSDAGNDREAVEVQSLGLRREAWLRKT